MLAWQLRFGKHCRVSWVCEPNLAVLIILKPMVGPSAKIVSSNKWFVHLRMRLGTALNVCPWLSWLWTVPSRSWLACHQLMLHLVSSWGCQLIASMACILCKQLRTRLSTGKILKILRLSICCRYNNIRSTMLILVGIMLSLMLVPKCCCRSATWNYMGRASLGIGLLVRS